MQHTAKSISGEVVTGELEYDGLPKRIDVLETENKFLRGKIRHLEKKLKKKEGVILGLKTTNEHQKERLEKLKDNIVFLP